MRKRFLIFLLLTLMLVGCNWEEQQELKTTTEKQSSNQETSLEETTSESSVTEKIATEESTTEEPTTEKTTDDTSTYTPNGKTPQLMIDVLFSDEEFTFVETDYEDKKIAIWPKVLSEFNYYINQFGDKPVEFGTCRVVDLDNDGYNEVIIDIPSNSSLILHYEDNEVYGFMYPWRGIKRIYLSGIFEGSSGAANTVYSVMEFDRDSFEVTEIAGGDNGVYYIEGKEVSLDEFREYINDDRFSGEVPYWNNLESILTTK